MKYDSELNLEDRNSLSILISRIKPNSTVLEFGPANGRMTKYMKEQLNCKVFAVEIDEESGKDAKPYTEKIVIDSIENYSWQSEFKDIKFDYIIFADVLEHLYYPEKVLKSVRDFLKEEGSILISIPNIAHNAIVMGLLQNEFNYSPTGLLDDTHIRFFTKKTFDNLIEKCGYFKAYETAVFMKPHNTEFGYKYNELSDNFAEYLLSLSHGEIYQLIYEIKCYEVEIFSDFSEEYKINSSNFIQLFIEDENGMFEENSIKYPVLSKDELQKFEFDLKDFENIKNLRLDPLNDSCVIEIDSIVLKKQDTSVDLMPYISSNCDIKHSNSYFFTTNDSQIYFENLPSDIFENTNSMEVSIRYAHISKDALEVTIKQELEQTKQELANIYTSKSWKITRPLRKIMRVLRGG